MTATDTTGAAGIASFTWTVSGTTAISGWTLKFALPGDQQITSG